MKALWALITFVLMAAVAEVGVWKYLKFFDLVLAGYILAFVGVIIAKIWGWPKTDWLGFPKLAAQEHQLALYPVGPVKDGATLQFFRVRLDMKQYFTSLLCLENTEKLCNDLSERLTTLTLAYGFAILLYMVLDSVGPDKMDFAHKLIRSYLAFGGIVLPLLWELSRWERQRGWNRTASSTVALPDHADE